MLADTADQAAATAAPAAVFETLLLVEEDDSIGRLLADSLRRRGYQVLEARSATEASAAFASYGSRIHLLLTEVTVGTDSGPELASRLKAADPLLQVLYMSGSTGASGGERPVLHGMPFIQKPFALQALADKVREVLETREGQA
jgi:DNA-binding NtrC family response regulator